MTAPAFDPDDIYNAVILPYLREEARGQWDEAGDGQVVLVAGQPGAGKTGMVDQIVGDYFWENRPEPVRLDLGMFRAFYPGYAEMARDLDEAGIREIVDAQAQQWFSKAVILMRSTATDVVIELPASTPQALDQLVTAFSNTIDPDATVYDQYSYKIIVAPVATPAAESELAMMMHRQHALDRKGFAREFGKEKHAAEYGQLLDLVDAADADARISVIAPYRRGRDGAQGVNYRDTEGNWTSEISTRATITAFRAERWGIEQSQQWVRSFASLWARTEPQNRPALQRLWEATATDHLALGWDAGRSPKTAVLFGRFQVPTMAQLDVIIAALHRFDRVVLASTDAQATPPRPSFSVPQLAGFLAERDRDAALDRNPMTGNEVTAMWQAVLADAGLTHRVDVALVARPENAPATFNAEFPPDRFEVIMASEQGNRAHAQSARVFAHLLNRPVIPVQPQILQQRDPGQLYRAGNPLWTTAIPRAALAVFTAADGPRRLFEQRPKHVPPDPESGWGLGVDRTQFKQSVNELQRWVRVLSYTENTSLQQTVHSEAARLHELAEQGVLHPSELPRAREAFDAVANGQNPAQDLWRIITEPAEFQQFKGHAAESPLPGVEDVLRQLTQNKQKFIDHFQKYSDQWGRRPSDPLAQPWTDPTAALEGPAGAGTGVGGE